jgi:putative FmdB family regulatory protein
LQFKLLFAELGLKTGVGGKIPLLAGMAGLTLCAHLLSVFDSNFAISMPTYDYQCQTCGHAFEAKQSMKDPHLTDCPQPGCAGPVQRKIGLGAGFIFKGSGFYITDYRSDAYKAAAKQESSSASHVASTGTGGASSAASSPPSTTT